LGEICRLLAGAKWAPKYPNAAHFAADAQLRLFWAGGFVLGQRRRFMANWQLIERATSTA